MTQRRISSRASQDGGGRLPWFLAIAAGLALSLVGFHLMRSQTAPATDVAPLFTEIGPDIKTVTALGHLEPAGQVISLAASAGAEGSLVANLLVQEGDGVKAGQMIAILDSHDTLQAAVLEAQQQVAIAQSDLNKVKAGAKKGEIVAQEAEIERLRLERTDQITAQEATIRRLEVTRAGEISAQQAVVDRLKAELKNTQSEAERYQELYDQGAIAESLLESYQLWVNTAEERLQEAEAALKQVKESRRAEIEEAQAVLKRIQSGQQQQILSAKATLEKISEVRPIDIQAAESQVKSAEASLTRAKAQLEKAYVKAPQDGTILKIHTRKGEQVGSGGIVDLGRTQSMMAIAEVYESDIDKIKIGQSATVTSDILKEKLTGAVEQIGMQIQRQNVTNTDPAANIDGRIIEVKIRLDDSSSRKVSHLTNLQVEVQIQR